VNCGGQGAELAVAKGRAGTKPLPTDPPAGAVYHSIGAKAKGELHSEEQVGDLAKCSGTWRNPDHSQCPDSMVCMCYEELMETNCICVQPTLGSGDVKHNSGVETAVRGRGGYGGPARTTYKGPGQVNRGRQGCGRGNVNCGGREAEVGASLQCSGTWDKPDHSKCPGALVCNCIQRFDHSIGDTRKTCFCVMPTVGSTDVKLTSNELAVGDKLLCSGTWREPNHSECPDAMVCTCIKFFDSAIKDQRTDCFCSMPKIDVTRVMNYDRATPEPARTSPYTGYWVTDEENAVGDMVKCSGGWRYPNHNECPGSMVCQCQQKYDYTLKDMKDECFCAMPDIGATGVFFDEKLAAADEDAIGYGRTAMVLPSADTTPLFIYGFAVVGAGFLVFQGATFLKKKVEHSPVVQDVEL